jgi:hypothetical protein
MPYGHSIIDELFERIDPDFDMIIDKFRGDCIVAISRFYALGNHGLIAHQ